MDIPNKIKVGGHVIDIKMLQSKHICGPGMYNDFHQLISLEKDVDTKESNVAETFLHEIIEAIKIKNNLDIDHTHLTVLSEGLFQVIRDNALNFT